MTGGGGSAGIPNWKGLGGNQLLAVTCAALRLNKWECFVRHFSPHLRHSFTFGLDRWTPCRVKRKIDAPANGAEEGQINV